MTHAQGSQTFVVADIGNSSLKLAEFRRAPCTGVPLPIRGMRVASRSVAEQLPEWFLGLEETVPVYGASVCRPVAETLTAWCQQTRPNASLRWLHWTDYPAAVDVEVPARVGADRLAVAAAVLRLKPADSAAICIDAGTAITVDLVAADGTFRGGAILPGWRAMARGLTDGTDLLPHCDRVPQDVPPVLGRNTEAAILSGLYWGGQGAVLEVVRRMTREFVAREDAAAASADLNSLPSAGQPQLFLSGGDAPWLSSALAESLVRVIVEPDLVLRGVARLVLDGRLDTVNAPPSDICEASG